MVLSPQQIMRNHSRKKSNERRTIVMNYGGNYGTSPFTWSWKIVSLFWNTARTHVPRMKLSRDKLMVINSDNDKVASWDWSIFRYVNGKDTFRRNAQEGKRLRGYDAERLYSTCVYFLRIVNTNLHLVCMQISRDNVFYEVYTKMREHLTCNLCTREQLTNMCSLISKVERELYQNNKQNYVMHNRKI